MNEDVGIKNHSSEPKGNESTLLLVTYQPDSTSSVNVKAVEVRFSVQVVEE